MLSRQSVKRNEVALEAASCLIERGERTEKCPFVYICVCVCACKKVLSLESCVFSKTWAFLCFRSTF